MVAAESHGAAGCDKGPRCCPQQSHWQRLIANALADPARINQFEEARPCNSGSSEVSRMSQRVLSAHVLPGASGRESSETGRSLSVMTCFSSLFA